MTRRRVAAVRRLLVAFAAVPLLSLLPSSAAASGNVTGAGGLLILVMVFGSGALLMSLPGLSLALLLGSRAEREPYRWQRPVAITLLCLAVVGAGLGVLFMSLLGGGLERGDATALAWGASLVVALASGALAGQCLGRSAPSRGQVLARWLVPAAVLGLGTLLLLTPRAGRSVSEWVRTGKVWRTLPGHFLAVRQVAFSPDGHLLASAGTDSGTISRARLWALPGGERRKLELPSHQREVRAVAFSADGKLLATAGADGLVQVAIVADGSPLASLTPEPAQAHVLAFEPDGKRLACGTRAGSIRLWTPGTTDAPDDLLGHEGQVEALTFAPSGGLLASTGNDGSVRLWNTRGAGGSRTLGKHIGGGLAVAFDRSGARLASAGSDRQVRLWDVASGALQRTIVASEMLPIAAVAFSADGSQLATGGWDSKLRLWSTSTGAQLAQLVDLHEDDYKRPWVTSVAYSPDGTLLAAGTSANFDNVLLFRTSRP